MVERKSNKVVKSTKGCHKSFDSDRVNQQVMTFRVRGILWLIEEDYWALMKKTVENKESIFHVKYLV